VSPEPTELEHLRGGFRIGGPEGVEVATRALMAPMVGYNEAPLRQICRRFGSGLAVTEMIKPEKILRRDPNVFRDLAFGESERPLGIQVAVREPDELLPALDLVWPFGFDFVDLNMGCPLKKECNKGWGAALLRDPEKVARLVAATVAASPVPVTVKVRTGYELEERTAPDVVEAAIEAGATMICVHGRTKMGWYREQNDLAAIAAVVERVAGRVPVVGNGDVVDLESALDMYRQTRCDAVMIGRGAMGNPWLFTRIDRHLNGGELLPEPSLEEVRSLYEEHMDGVVEIFGERKGFAQVRRYAFYYFGRFGLGNEWRRQIAGTRSRAAMGEVLDGVAQAVQVAEDHEPSGAGS
tara:strand:+ start:1220 stop:2278 length:1059 start_codon:yes stop_codon:yes gene_type:complete